MQANFKLVERAAEELVRRLLPADKARIGSFASKIQIDPEDFTSDQQTLIEILRYDLQPAGPTPLWNATNEAIDALLPQSGRRVVLLFTDGMDAPGNFKTNNLTVMAVTNRATEENVMVYGIGLQSRPAPGSTPFQIPMPGGRPGGGFPGGWQRGMFQFPDPGLGKIADETGGGHFELTTTAELSSTFARVADELHQQYSLGFEPMKLDGKVHEIEVRLKKSGMKARARKSYIASKEPTQ
jgi:VWFA-related protein